MRLASEINCKNKYRIYVDIKTRENCRQYMLLTLKSFIGQFVNPIGREDWSKSGIVTLARCELHFIREHKNLK